MSYLFIFACMSVLQKEVYESIRSRLLNGHWNAGDRLREETLAAELKVKRHPVREALFKLSSEGLLERETGLGCRVGRADAKTVEHLWELRESLEGMAARLAARRMEEMQLIRLEHEHELMQRFPLRGPAEVFVESENRFHLLLLEGSGNPTLREIWNQHLVRAIVAQVALIPQHVNIARVYRETFRDHARIVAALKARDPDRAEQAARAHIASARERILRILVAESRSASDPISPASTGQPKRAARGRPRRTPMPVDGQITTSTVLGVLRV